MPLDAAVGSPHPRRSLEFSKLTSQSAVAATLSQGRSFEHLL